MGDVGLQLGLVVVLVLLNAAFSGSEIAMISLRPNQVDKLRSRDKRGRTLAKLVEDPNEFLATIQIGITLAGFLASATAAVSLAEPLLGPLSFLGAAARPVAIFAVTLVLSFLTLVFGELAPKRVAMQRAEGWALRAARPLQALASASKPAVWLLSGATDLVVRLSGGDPSRRGEDVSDEEVRDLVLTRTRFSGQHEIFQGTFDLSERVVRDILTPRTEVLLVAPEAPAREALRQLIDASHSRAPVGRDLDSCGGVVHLHDLVRAGGTAQDAARPALFVPETLGVLDALRRLQNERQHLAVVVDEHGGGAGVVTLEDVLEELVGEIYDEFDRDSSAVQVDVDGSVVLPGAFPVHDLADLNISLPSGSYTTVAGLVLSELGRLPEHGASTRVGDWRIEVLDVTDRAISRVKLVPDPR